MSRLSVILITKNESQHIQACLQSVLFADEVIVVDSGSTDNTVELAQQLGAQVHITNDWPGFGVQKNRALDLATNEWVLSIDADERVTSELAEEIQRIIQNPDADAYKIARLSCFGGRWMRHSGWWPDRVLRLFRKSAGRFSEDIVHESVQGVLKVGVLQHHFLHYTYDSLENMIAKINHYSTAAAQAQFARGRRISLAGVVGKSVWTFIRLYLLRRGFLDGKQGFLLALVSSTSSLYRYSKLWFLGKQTNWKPKAPDGSSEKN